MNIMKAAVAAVFLMFSVGATAQEQENREEHTNENKFRQLNEEFSTPNRYRTASGAPGSAYYQNTADYKMDLELDDINQKITGHETITYHNNSPDDLEYLWVQLDQNMRAPDSESYLKDSNNVPTITQPESFVSEYMEERFQGGFNITEVSAEGQPLVYVINNTMMRVDLPEPLKAGESYSFDIAWWYNVHDYSIDRGRGGYEYFPEDKNYLYVIAQFFPRMAVYNDVEGWQNMQFWADGEFALPFGDYEVNLTVPADHIVEGTGELVNREEVFSREMLERYEEAKNAYDSPVMIVTEEEARAAEEGSSGEKKTWKFRAEMVRDFAFASSRKFIWDMMAVDLGEKDVMAVSLYPKEGNPLWEDFSTKVVAHTLKSYSEHTFDYPYPKAVSVHAKEQGMEYPMISWNHGRPNEDGTYSDAVKFGMISVIIHEIGHNYFPMIVNSDERNWGWMDEGVNAFVQYLTEQKYGEKYPEDIAPRTSYPSRRGDPSKIVSYMKSDQRFQTPIMSNPENVYQLGNNVYGKPATALNILRETVVGEELFDHAFKTYAQRWMFKHPTPEDFFRTMEDASAVDLDWFWRGWFYTTDYVDIGIEDVKEYYVTGEPTETAAAYLKRRGYSDPTSFDGLYLVEQGSEEMEEELKGRTPAENAPKLKEYLMENFTPQERQQMKEPKYLYEITFNKPGGLIMPIIAEYTHADGISERIQYPAQIWRKNHQQVSRVIATEKEIVKVTVDPDLQTADVDLENNVWPRSGQVSDFE